MTSLVVLLALSSKSEARLNCEECVQEMHKLGVFAKFYGKAMTTFLEENYCPTLESEDCVHDINTHYAEWVSIIIDHFIVDGAVHMCGMMMACPAKQSYKETMVQPRALTCDECVEGLDYISRWMLDDFVVDDMVVYLEANFCLPTMQNCDRAVRIHFPAMHEMAMSEFFIPMEICQKQDFCQA